MAVALAPTAGSSAAAAGTDTSERTLSLYNIHTQERLTTTFKRNGKFVPEELQKLNWFLRDWRRNEQTTMDPALFDLLWQIHTELGSKEPIHVISGYRSRATNDMLRRTVGGQASQSRHILGKACDVEFPDVPLRMLRYSALIQERGGVGYYPHSSIPFVHVDVDRTRAWPRLPRAELALLFPSGKTRHVPMDGVPLTPADVREARKNPQLVAVVSAFNALRNKPKLPVQTASLTPDIPLPRLLGPPQPARRLAPPVAEPAPLPAPVTDAPESDEERPDELSYKPFPIAPLLTATASVDDPALTVMVHPDLTKVLELMDRDDALPALALRAGAYHAEAVLASQPKGVPLDLSMLSDSGAEAADSQRRSKVANQPQ